MNFLSPWFLAGLATLAVPVLVHLIQKERQKVIPFPSLMFITNLPYQTVRRRRIQHWVLFLLRCLAILLLVFAFARPFLGGQSARASTSLLGDGRDLVILLDRSYSMEYGDRWKRAIAAASNVVNNMNSGDRAIVVYFSGTATAATNLTSDKAALLTAIDSVRPTAGATRYDAAFRIVQQIFGDTARPRREVVLVSDYQRSGWNGRDFPPLPSGTTLTSVHLGDSITANVVITDVDVRHDSADNRERVFVTARLANQSSQPATNRAVTFELNGRQMQTRSIDIPANGVTKIDFDGVAIPAGNSRGVIRTTPDALERDNRIHFIVTRRQPIPVLLVQPQTNSEQYGFLAKALSIGNTPAFRVEEVRMDQFSANALSRTKLVILNDVPFPDGALGRRLMEYVKTGGGLFVVLGSQSQPGKWPTIMEEILPRPTTSPIERLADHGATLGFLDYGHSVFELFNAPRTGDFSSTRFFRYWKMDPGPNDRQLARFQDGRIALLERRVGAGRVLVWTSALDGLWSDLPLQPVFLPFLHQAVKYTSDYRQERRWTIGEVVSPSALFGKKVYGADSATADAATLDKAQYVAITPTAAQVRVGPSASLEFAEQGFYEINRTHGAEDATQLVAVTLDLAESDLTPLDTTLLSMVASPGATNTDGMKRAAELTSADLERRQNVWWYLVMIALLLLGIETLLSNRLSRVIR